MRSGTSIHDNDFHENVCIFVMLKLILFTYIYCTVTYSTHFCIKKKLAQNRGDVAKAGCPCLQACT